MLLSICIPCNKRINQVRNTLNSIYYINSEIPLTDYEVIISDNDKDMEVKGLMHEFSDKPNLFYFHTDCEGFLNSYYALSYGKGLLLKLHNSQMTFRKGALGAMVTFVKENREKCPLVFYSNGLLERFEIKRYCDFNSYMYGLSYWSSWSGGMTIWKKDFDFIDKITLNPLFPHTSVFMTQHSKTEYVIDDRQLFEVQRIPHRGGHNKFEAFTIHYPSLLAQSCKEGHITECCRDKIYKAIYEEFIPTLLFNKYIIRIETFDARNYKENNSAFFPKSAYWMSWLFMLVVPFRMIKRKIKLAVNKKSMMFCTEQSGGGVLCSGLYLWTPAAIFEERSAA